MKYTELSPAALDAEYNKVLAEFEGWKAKVP